MFVKKLTIEHFGRFGYKNFHFCDSLNVIAGEDTRAVFAALNLALCNRFPPKSMRSPDPLRARGKILTAVFFYRVFIFLRLF